MKYLFAFLPVALSLSLGLIFPFAALAHGDEIPTDPGVAKDHFTAYGQSDKYEMTLYFGEIKPGLETSLTLFLADFNHNHPIEGAELSVSILENPQIKLDVTPISAGVYQLKGIFPENKIYTLTVQVVHAKGADLIGIKGLEVGKILEVAHADLHEEHTPEWIWFLGGLFLGGALMWFLARRRNRVLTMLMLMLSAWLAQPGAGPAFAHGDDEHGAEGGTGFGKTAFAPKETQFLFEIWTQPIVVGDYHATTSMFGTIVPSVDGLGVVVAPQNGRITRVSVVVGQRVKAGQVIAELQQSIATADMVGIASNNASLALEVEAAKNQVNVAKNNLDRLRKVSDIAAGKDVLTAEIQYQTALTALQILEKEALVSNAAANRRSVPLLAPISGVVGDFTLTPGAEVLAGQTLISVTNLNKVYVEAQVYDRDVPVIRSGNQFLVNCSTDNHKTAEVRLISQAQTMNPGNQSQRVFFELDNPQGEFKIGEFVTIKALDNSTLRNITVPNSAITEINGKTAVFIKHAPEEFELAYVQIGEEDGARTLILKGVEAGERVVVNGAYEVKMMYLNQ